MIADPQIQARINEFKGFLPNNSTSRILRKYVTFGEAYTLERSQYFELKSEVADHFQIHPSEIVVVGSAKLGFSIAPQKRYNPFGNASDIDVAIICGPLFDKIWEQVLQYWSDHSFWSTENDFKKYLFQGWIRPDKLPPANRFDTRRDWWEFFRILTNSNRYGSYKIAAGLYKSWHFFETYQSICINQCKRDIGANI